MQKDDHALAREYLEAGAPFRADSDFVDKDLVKKAGKNFGPPGNKKLVRTRRARTPRTHAAHTRRAHTPRT